MTYKETNILIKETKCLDLMNSLQYCRWDNSSVLEYKTCYEDHKKLLNFIEMPMNSEEISFFENDVKDKIVIFHGLNRYGFKGTRHIEAAFKILEKNIPRFRTHN